MKKKLIFIALIACVLLAFTFTACEEPVQKSIVITGIPSTTDYNYGYVGLGSNSDLVAISLPVKISGGTFTGELLTPDADPFTDSGSYQVVLIISSDSKGQEDVYNGIKANHKIEDEVTTISFNSFTDVTSSSSSSIRLNQFFKK